MKIQLIHPPKDQTQPNLKNGYKSLPPPTGLEILASYLELNIPSIEIEIFDGNVLTISQIERRLDGDIIGISDWFTSHTNATKLAELAKKRNPDCAVLIGGPNASNLGTRILANHPSIDYVVYGDGEETLLGVAKGDTPSEIPNLWYRNNGIRYSFTKNFDMKKAALFNLEHLQDFNLEKYDSRLAGYSNSPDLAPMPISSVRGCLKAERNAPCTFCALLHEFRARTQTPEQFWIQIDFLNSRYGIRKFMETGDSFIVHDYPEELLKHKPEGIDIHLRIYATLGSLTPKKIKVLAHLGVKEIFIGLENVDPSVQRFSNKEYNVRAVVNTLKTIESFGMQPFLSFIFGLPGETVASMDKNYHFACHVVEKVPSMRFISFNPGVPIIGSPWFDLLSRNKVLKHEYNVLTNRDLDIDDNPDYELLFLMSLREYTTVSLSDFLRIFMKPLPQSVAGNIAGFGSLIDNILQSPRHLEIAKSFWSELPHNKRSALPNLFRQF